MRERKRKRKRKKRTTPPVFFVGWVLKSAYLVVLLFFMRGAELKRQKRSSFPNDLGHNRLHGSMSEPLTRVLRIKKVLQMVPMIVNSFISMKAPLRKRKDTPLFSKPPAFELRKYTRVSLFFPPFHEQPNDWNEMDDLRVLVCQNLILRIQYRYATPFENGNHCL